MYMGLDQARLEGEEYYQVGAVAGPTVQGFVEMTALACPALAFDSMGCLTPAL